MGKYIRKETSGRARWSEESLAQAMSAVRDKKMGVNEASREYGIPSRTLRRRIIKNSTKKLGLGPYGILGYENELRLVRHIKRLEESGFALTSRDLRALAFSFSKKLGLDGKFSQEKQIAGYDWFRSFMQRHRDLSVRQAEGLSTSRALALNRETVRGFYDLLKKTLIDNELIGRPGHIYNMDESGLQLINKVGKIIATKGAKEVFRLTSGERGETITIVACCNAEGNFLPPLCIFKGVNKKPEFEDGMPAGSRVVMNKDSAYINSTIFMVWLKEHFVPRKPAGKVLLILDGHASHSNDFEMLEYAKENYIIILCLPPHTTKYLQPLDRSFFKPLKAFYNQVSDNWFTTNRGRKITRLQFGTLLGKAWEGAATNANACKGFKACGIHPFDENAIPDVAFSVSDASSLPQETHSSTINENPRPSSSSCNSSQPTSSSSGTSAIPEPSCSAPLSTSSSTISTPITKHTCSVVSSSQMETPTKILLEISPPPKIAVPRTSRVKRNIHGKILTSENRLKVATKGVSKKQKSIAKASKKVVELTSSDTDNSENGDDDRCKECHEYYYVTREECDWIMCIVCKKWLHENCTIFSDTCIDCGRNNKGKKGVSKNAKK